MVYFRYQASWLAWVCLVGVTRAWCPPPVQHGALTLSRPRPTVSRHAANMDEVDSRYMDLAIEEARRAFEAQEVPVGAVLVSEDGEVITRCYNRVEQTGDASSHAELECLRAAAVSKGQHGWRMLNCTLYVTLEPCLMCLGAIQSFRVRRLVYGAKNPLLGAVESHYHVLEVKHPFHSVQTKGGVRAAECGQLLKDFFRLRRRRKGLS